MTFAALAVAAFCGVLIDYSVRPLAGGGHEYIIQVPPELIDTLRAEGIDSYVPPEARDVRRIRIQVGSAPLADSDASRAAPDGRAGVDETTPASPDAASAKADARTHVAQYAVDPRSGAAADANGESQHATDVDASAGNFLGLDARTLLQIGLGLAALLVFCLTWLHLSMRARYRELLFNMNDKSRRLMF
jgi:hypothetical protein